MSLSSLSSTSQVPRKPPQRADQVGRGGPPSSNAVTRCFLGSARGSGLAGSDGSPGHWTYSAVADLQVEKRPSSWRQKSQASCPPILAVCICQLMEYRCWLPIMCSWGFRCLALQGLCEDPISFFHLPQCFAEGIVFPLWGVIHEMMFQRQVPVIMPFQIPACQRKNYLRNLKLYIKWEISAAVLVQLACGFFST